MLIANVRFHYHECLYLEYYIKSYSYNDKLKLVNKGIYPMASANSIAPSFNKLVLIIFNYYTLQNLMINMIIFQAT